MTRLQPTARLARGWQLAALAALITGLAACGPSSPDSARYAQGPTPAPAEVAPAPQPTEVAPPPTTAPALPRSSVPAPRTAAGPKPAPIESPAPQRAAQAPAVVAAAPAAPPREVKPAGQYGRVASIETLRSEAKSNGSGAVIGGVLGGVLGHQIGGGNGKTAATAIGAVGGAVAGNQIEKSRSREVIGYRVNVQLDNGQTRTVTVNTLDGLSQGARVRYADGHLYHA